MRFWKGLNLPNRLTVIRLLMTPVFFFFLLLPAIPGCGETRIFSSLLAALLFLAAAITDHLDGRYARKHGQITELGKFLDPIADKLMVFAAFLGLLCLEKDDPLFFLLLAAVSLVTLAREFAVTGLRTLLSGRQGGKILPAGILGKIKTVGQIVFVLCALLEPLLFGELLGRFLPIFGIIAAFRPLTYASMLFMTVMTVVSGLQYFQAYLEY